MAPFTINEITGCQGLLPGGMKTSMISLTSLILVVTLDYTALATSFNFGGDCYARMEPTKAEAARVEDELKKVWIKTMEAEQRTVLIESLVRAGV